MIRKSILACVCIGGAILGAAAIAQPDKGKQPAVPAGMPSPDEMAKMMEIWKKASTPGKMHEHLMKGVGTWNGKVKSWAKGPGMPPSETACTTVVTGMMGGRFTRGETKGQMDLGAGPADYEGFGVYGFNNTTGAFESTWCDNQNTMMLNFDGKLSDDGKVLTWTGTFKDCFSGQDTTLRMTETFTGPDSMVLAMFQPDPTKRAAR